MEREQVIERLRAKQSVIQAAGVERVQLFGSTARGHAGPQSDVDYWSISTAPADGASSSLAAFKFFCPRLLGPKSTFACVHGCAPRSRRTFWQRQSMSSRNLRIYLEDILESVETIQRFVAGMNFEEYRADLKTRSAVERQFLIIAEASTRIGADIAALCPGPEWREIRGIGNFIRHRYQDVLDEVLWESIEVDFPPLHAAVTAALANRTLWDATQ